MFGPKLEERWASINNILLEDTPVPTLKIELEDVPKKDMRTVAEELVSSGYGQSFKVTENGIAIFDYDMLMCDVDAVQDIVTSLLGELNYQLLTAPQE